MSELFPAESVSVDSPRLKWMKKYGVQVYDFKSPGESPETGSHKRWAAGTGILNYCEGDTELEAISEWAKSHGIALWDEPVKA